MRTKPLLVLAAALLSVLAACATGVSFQNAKLGPDDQNTRRVSGLLFKPEGKGPFPAVVLLHTCGGLKPHVTGHWPDYLTGLGYAVMTVDTFGSRAFEHCPVPLSWREVYQEMTRDAYGALDYLASLPDVDGNRIAVMGFSLGANAINNYLILPSNLRPLIASGGLDFKAAIALYGRCDRLSQWTQVSIQLMHIVGDKDTFHVESCRSQLVGNNSEIEVHVLPSAYHSFDSPRARGYEKNGMLMQYSASATKKARELTKAFFAKHLGK